MKVFRITMQIFTTIYCCSLLVSCIAIDYLQSENVYCFENNSHDTVVLHTQYAPWCNEIEESIKDSLIFAERIVPPTTSAYIGAHGNNLTDTFLPSDAISYIYILSTSGDTLCVQNPIDDSLWEQNFKTTTINDGFYISYILHYPY